MHSKVEGSAGRWILSGQLTESDRIQHKTDAKLSSNFIFCLENTDLSDGKEQQIFFIYLLIHLFGHLFILIASHRTIFCNFDPNIDLPISKHCLLMFDSKKRGTFNSRKLSGV